jgi:hypothetical protein
MKKLFAYGGGRAASARLPETPHKRNLPRIQRMTPKTIPPRTESKAGRSRSRILRTGNERMPILIDNMWKPK